MLGACGSATGGGSSDGNGAAAASGTANSPRIGTTPAAASTPNAAAAQVPEPSAAVAGPLTVDDLLAVAETLAPLGGIERNRLTSDGSAAIHWNTPESLEALQSHYASLARDGGFRVLVDAETGGIQSWVFGGLRQAFVNASVQVTPMPGEGHLVAVTISPA